MTQQIGLRLKPELMADIDAWRKQIRPEPSLCAAARELIIEGLASFKRKAEVEKPAKASRPSPSSAGIVRNMRSDKELDHDAA